MTFATPLAVAALAVLALCLTGCEKPAKAGRTKNEGPGRTVSEAAFKADGKTWPLTIAEARVGCDAPGALFVMSAGKKYALNDWATRRDGYLDLGEIRSTAKEGPQGKASTDDLVLAARTACNW